MRLLNQIWKTDVPWKVKRMFLAKLASEATASGDLALALEAWRYVRHGDCGKLQQLTKGSE